MIQACADFSFDPEDHRYRVAGREIPACTRVLSSGGLVSFDHVNRDILERKSELGRQVHKACHLYNQNKNLICDPEVEGYLQSWVKFKQQTKLQIMHSETQWIASVNGMEYGMQLDVEADLLGIDIIIEIKIGEVLPHHGIQLAGYAAGAYHRQLKTGIGRFRSRKRIAVQLQKDGSLAKVHRFEDKSDFDVFVSALYTTYWKQKHSQFYKGDMP